MSFQPLLKPLKPYRAYCIIGPLFKLAEAVLELYLPLLMAQVIDHGVASGDTAYIRRMGLIMLGIVATGLGCAIVCQYMASVTSQGYGTELRRRVFGHILSFSHAELDRLGTSSLINRVTGDVNQLQYAVAMLIRLVIRAPFLCIGGAIMALLIDWRLALIVLALIPLFVLVITAVMRKTVPLHRAVQKRLDRLTLVLRENLSGIRVIRAFSRTVPEQKRFAEATEEHTDASIRVGRISTLLNPLTQLLMNCGILAIVWFGGVRIQAGSDLTTGEIVALINYINQILLALTVVANLVVTFSKAYASAGRITELLEVTSSVREAENAAEMPVDGAPAVQFSHVSFSYGGEDTLTDIDFSVPVGSTVGIIGGTGSGKTTLVSLLMRFYDVTEGAVYLHGQDIRTLPAEALRREIGLVPQRVELFSGTIADNLRLGAPQATENDLRRAAKIAQAAEFIDQKPEKYDTVAERGGTNFSGGQRQRLAIARALVSSPRILVLDDASSALDYATDAALRREIAALKGVTVFLISQRVSSIRHTDRILVLDDGCLAGQGTHEELLRSCALYREICASQEKEDSV